MVGAAVVDPIGTLGGIGLGKLFEQGQLAMQGRFSRAGYDDADAVVGGKGAVFLAGILGGGPTSKIGGFIESSFSRVFGGMHVATGKRAANRTGGLSAIEANAPHIAAGSRPPYAAGTRARDIVLENERMFVRVRGEGNQARSWMMRPHEIEELRVGTVGSQEGWGVGGGIQHELQQRLPASAFTNRRPLP